MSERELRIVESLRGLRDADPDCGPGMFLIGVTPSSISAAFGGSEVATVERGGIIMACRPATDERILAELA